MSPQQAMTRVRILHPTTTSTGENSPRLFTNPRGQQGARFGAPEAVKRPAAMALSFPGN